MRGAVCFASHWIWLILLCTCVLQSSNGGELETIFTRCCSLGATWASQDRSCELYPAPIGGVGPEHQPTCLATIGICCLRHYRILMCDVGKDDAIQNNPCSKYGKHPGGEFRKDCCDGCKLGLMAGTTGDACSMNSFGFDYPWDEAFADCCQLGKLSAKEGIAAHQLGGIVNFHLQRNQDNHVPETNRCEQVNPCQHKCHDTGGETVECSCHPGYQLSDDQRACVDMDECLLGLHTCDRNSQKCTNTDGGFLCINENGSFESSNTRPQYGSLQARRTTYSPEQPVTHTIEEDNHHSTEGAEVKRCPKGYEFNVATRTCNDVDECKLNTHNCDLFIQNCLNKIGGFECTPKSSNQCPPGFKFNQNILSCIDVDECAEGKDFCNRNREFCLNTIGGYECQPKSQNQCPAGYKFNDHAKTCEDVDECEENLHNCDAEREQCRNAVGGYECDLQCQQGFRYSMILRTCIDIDECAENIDDCNDAAEDCANTIGSYQCYTKPLSRCPAGYKPGSTPDNTCEDVDECSEDLDSCDKFTEICVNDIGRYHCEQRTPDTIDCSTGYRFDPTRQDCTDVDECAENLHDCDLTRSLCINTQGGFRCQILPCRTGYRLNAVDRLCEDINECLENLHNCSALTSECVNTQGGFECRHLVPRSCPSGFIFNAVEQKCEDVNECLEGLSSCVPNKEVCVNTIGSYTCTKIQCPQGFRPNSTSRKCEDINECTEGLHNCSTPEQECVNSIGGFQCRDAESPSCPGGHRYNPGAQRCEDINECHEGSHSCIPDKEICINAVGSFVCRALVCPAGYRPNILARTCVDINECEEHSHNCSSEEDCINRIGSFSCHVAVVLDCQQGFAYSRISKTCEDVDECNEGLHDCSPDSQICVNSEGSYKCQNKPSSHIPCPQGYRFNLTLKRCEDVNECAENLHQCPPEQQDCINTAGGYECRMRKPQCRQGLRMDQQTRSCVDVDECSEGQHNCNPTTTVCVNLYGTFECRVRRQECAGGLRYDEVSRKCQDVDECTEKSDNCDPSNQVCVNTHGSFYCTLKPHDCPPGYRYDLTHNNCLDINECLLDTHNCDDTQICVNGPGNFQCQAISPSSHQCSVGFRYNIHSKSCVDLNECQVGSHNCATSQRCDNTIGSFTCIRITGCGTGYTLNAQSGQCEDDNECVLGTHNCGGVYVCRNTLGSFRCDRKVCPQKHKLDSSTGRCYMPNCNKGFEPDFEGECTDINECTLPNACQKNQLCLNTVGSFKCESHILCNEGYTLNDDGSKCVDVDECEQGTHDCRGNQNCINRPGGYACQCPPGYSITSQRECEDINECERYGEICTEQGECRNTPGSYICHCKSGFTQTEDGKTCIDLDECEQKYICQQKCINSWGSYQCSCDQGYNLADDKRSCIDVDECREWQGRGNLCIGICTNEPGSYSCRCPEGYKLAADKRTCQDIDECSQGTVCTGTNEVCLNTRGGFRCNTIVCPPNYVRDTDHRNRCKRVSLVCQQGDADCLRAPLSFSYNYFTFVSNLRIPASGQIDLFTMRGPLWTSTTVHFSLELISARAPGGVTAATRDFFRLRRTSIPNQAVVSLLQSIQGPQDIEVELIMKLYSNGHYGGQAVAKIFIYVSQHEF